MAKTAVVAVDGLGSVRHIVDASLDPVYSVNHTPYGELWNAQGTSPMPFGFTGEWQDPNDLLFLRARYYNPAQAAFLKLDPLEGGLQRPAMLNRFAYVQADPVNFVDPSGLYNCSSNGVISGACVLLRDAVSRAEMAGVVGAGVDDLLNTIFTANRQNSEEKAFRFAETYIETLFGVSIELWRTDPQQMLSQYTNCTLAPKNPDPSIESQYQTAMRTLLRVSAALMHIAARLGEAGRTNAIKDFAQSIGRRELRIFLNAPDSVTGGAGRGDTKETGEFLHLGNSVTLATIVHELGHAFERPFSSIMRNNLGTSTSRVYVSSMARQAVFSTDGTELSRYSDRTDVLRTGYDGMIARANSEATPGEVWPDMFMTWVLAGNYTLDPSIYEVTEPITGINTEPDWDCSSRIDRAQANFKYVFTELGIDRLLSAGTLGDDFMERINEIIWPNSPDPGAPDPTCRLPCAVD